MTATIPEIEPSEITAGLSAHWTISAPNYLPSAGYALYYYLIKKNKQIVMSGSDNGDNSFLFEITALISTTYEAGEYSFKLVAVLGDDCWEIRQGRMVVLPNYIASVNGIDYRSHNKITLENIQATIRRGSIKGEKSYSINGKSVERYTWDELLKAEAKYKQYVLEEEKTERIKNGRGNSSKILARFV